MSIVQGNLVWAPKVKRNKIQQLYESDARGIIDLELIDEVGWGLWERCDSILTVTAAHHGHVWCPSCASTMERQEPWSDEELLACPKCGWEMPWLEYHQTYRGKQLYGANAVAVFGEYHEAFPHAPSPSQKMLLIDQLIHSFHIGIKGIGRPVASNLIEGMLKEVIHFLDGLTTGSVSATGLSDSHAKWRQTAEAASWANDFLPGKKIPEMDP